MSLAPTTIPPRARSAAPLLRRQLRLLAVCTALLVICFVKPLYALVQWALHGELYSHILLIPFISPYLAWLKTKAEGGKQKAENISAFSFQLSALTLSLLSITAFFLFRSRLHLAAVDSLSWSMFSFFLFFIAACCFCLSRQTLRTLAFPIGFLIFIVPFPVIIRDAIEAFLQHTSADAAALFFSLVGTPYLRQDVAFQLPGISLAVAPECSGIRSTLVLFITSLIASERRPERRL